MAVQMHVAFSATIRRVGVYAGGPYHCAQGTINKATTSCMSGSTPPDVAAAIASTTSFAKSGAIDATTNLKSSRVFMFSGTADATVKPPVMNALYKYYANFVPEDSIEYINTVNAAHTFPSDDSANINSCTTSSSPYISNCRLDGAGLALEAVYDGLIPRNNAALTGKFIEFDQSEFASGASMAATAWAYVPQACASGAACKLHVALHGCLQNYATIGDKYVRNTGYNKWADTNNFVVIYPQTVSSYFSPSNPNGCWDWWGYLSTNYDTKNGPQMKAIKAMIDRIGSGYAHVPAPTGLAVLNTTDTEITVSWKLAPATAYNIYRDGVQVNSAAYKGNVYRDGGLSSGTMYTYTVTAVTESGAESPQSAPVQGTTTGNPPPIKPPTGLASTATTASTATLKWNAASGAYAYNVYRNGNRVNTSPVQATEFTDSGLQAETTYSYQATAIDEIGMESSRSDSIQVTTKSAWQCKTFRTNNYQQVADGRAHQSLGYVYANGSNDAMGLYNLAVTHTLAETADGYYIIGNCP
eukprot:TRINITY_DN5009_c0_g1_i2.p1 TRINITY_DN5009_c0_g1~~TRINITY_DN5009_c0_g1_i2.p1  ORF type:complete len:527 (+),score=73.08 TRINITY_DN5009_c0_g1_i2:223-1803(+)